MQPLQICISPTIRIGRESWCLPYAGFLLEGVTVKIDMNNRQNWVIHFGSAINLTKYNITFLYLPLYYSFRMVKPDLDH